jgi:hypothetical protein
MPNPTAQTYLGYDLVIQSEFHLPGAAKATSASAPQITITASPVHAPHPTKLYSLTDGAIHGIAPGIATFTCCADGQIRVQADPSCDAATAAKLIVASALPAMLWMRGDIVLHAAIAIPSSGSRAVAICGPSGAGKSTVLSQLLKRGARIVADDSARITPMEGMWQASGLPGGYYASAGRGGRLADRTFVLVPPEHRKTIAPLCFLLELARGDPEALASFERLKGGDALAALLRARHRPVVARLLDTEAHYLSTFAAMTHAIRIFRWVRPEGAVMVTENEFNQLDDICA